MWIWKFRSDPKCPARCISFRALVISAHEGASGSCRIANHSTTMFAHGGAPSILLNMFENAVQSHYWRLDSIYMFKRWCFCATSKNRPQKHQAWCQNDGTFAPKQQNGRISLVFASAKPTTFSEHGGCTRTTIHLIDRCAFWCLLKKHQNGHWNCIVNWFWKRQNITFPKSICSCMFYHHFWNTCDLHHPNGGLTCNFSVQLHVCQNQYNHTQNGAVAAWFITIIWPTLVCMKTIVLSCSYSMVLYWNRCVMPDNICN